MPRFQNVMTKIHQWIRAAGGYMRLWMAPVVLATIVVAVLAGFVHREIASQGFKIQKELADQEIAIQKESARQEMQRAAVSRAVALYQDFVGAKAVQKLRETQYQIEHLIWMDTKGKSEERTISVFKKLFKRKQIPAKKTNKKDEIREYLVGTFQRIKLIYKCGNFQKIYEKRQGDEKKGESLCDKSTISTLLGGIFAELFYAFRPVFYCDKFFVDNYYQKGKFSGYVGMWESLVIDHLERDMNKKLGEQFGIFRDQAEKKKAITGGQFGENNQNFTVLRLIPKRCEIYPKQKR